MSTGYKRSPEAPAGPEGVTIGTLNMIGSSYNPFEFRYKTSVSLEAQRMEDIMKGIVEGTIGDLLKLLEANEIYSRLLPVDKELIRGIFTNLQDLPVAKLSLHLDNKVEAVHGKFQEPPIFKDQDGVYVYCRRNPILYGLRETDLGRYQLQEALGIPHFRKVSGREVKGQKTPEEVQQLYLEEVLKFHREFFVVAPEEFSSDPKWHVDQPRHLFVWDLACWFCLLSAPKSSLLEWLKNSFLIPESSQNFDMKTLAPCSRSYINQMITKPVKNDPYPYVIACQEMPSDTQGIGLNFSSFIDPSAREGMSAIPVGKTTGGFVYDATRLHYEEIKFDPSELFDKHGIGGAQKTTTIKKMIIGRFSLKSTLTSFIVVGFHCKDHKKLSVPQANVIIDILEAVKEKYQLPAFGAGDLNISGISANLFNFESAIASRKWLKYPSDNPRELTTRKQRSLLQTQFNKAGEFVEAQKDTLFFEPCYPIVNGQAVPALDDEDLMPSRKWPGDHKLVLGTFHL